jgi:hypothetical protein
MNENTKTYSSKVTYASKELSAREKIKIKDVSACKKLDELTQNGEHIIINVDFYAIVSIHNEKADDTDYNNVVIVDKDGSRYVTGSNSFKRSLDDIMDELIDAGVLDEEDILIDVYTKPSKNYSGKSFITCSLT